MCEDVGVRGGANILVEGVARRRGLNLACQCDQGRRIRLVHYVVPFGGRGRGRREFM